MSDLSASEAKAIGASVRYLPFGIPGLDAHVRGVPSGSAVLLAGAPDAGGKAFVYTALASLMLAKHDPEMYHRRIGPDRRAAIPERVHYVALTEDREHVYADLDAVLDDRQFAALTDRLTVADFSQRFLAAAPVPEALFENRREEAPVGTGTTDAGGDGVADAGGDDVDDGTAGEGIDGVLDAVAESVADAGEEAVVVIDDLSDLARAERFGLDRARTLGFLMGLREAVVGWNGLAYVLFERRAGAVRDDPDVSGLLHGSVYCYSNDQGHATYRTLRVGSFGGALDTERQTVFETSVGPAGLRAKATKKLAPSKW